MTCAAMLGSLMSRECVSHDARTPSTMFGLWVSSEMQPLVPRPSRHTSPIYCGQLRHAGLLLQAYRSCP